ncbi:MAG: hypothetical protein K0S49_51 [Microbacterium sp.]|jgi:hypothetical protein|nr:hypothetical protein [Microbacterium sp.]
MTTREQALSAAAAIYVDAKIRIETERATSAAVTQERAA